LEVNAMRAAELSRPKLVWVISIVVGLMAVADVVILSWLFVRGPSSPALRNVVASVSALDWVTLYVLSGILLMSMVFLFRLRSRAISWFAVYVGLASWVVWAYAIAPENPPFFDELVSLAGLLVALGIFGYMLRLRKRHVLT
jgi:hypothetical protein